MGGGLKAVNPEIQHRMAEACVREAGSIGAEAIVTPCQTCYLGLLNGVNGAGSSRMQILHLNELLVRSICPDISHESVGNALARTKPWYPRGRSPGCASCFIRMISSLQMASRSIVHESSIPLSQQETN